MTNLTDTHLRTTERDRLFFFVMALAIAVTVVAGFALQYAMGRSSLASPWWVHLHGVTMVGWLLIYVAQNWLVWRGQTHNHRKFGYVASFYLGWVLVVGLATTPTTIAFHRDPPFFGSAVFLMMDGLNIVTFVAIAGIGIAMRRESDWHRRLMLCSAFLVMMPGLGRLSPLPLLGSWILWAIFTTALPFWIAAATYDLITRRRIHPAYLWGFCAFVTMTALIRPLASTALVTNIIKHLTS